jgi:hypothetical protein
MKRRWLMFVVAGLLLLGLPAFAQADGDSGGGVNKAIAINKRDGATVVRTAFSVRHVTNGTVDQKNYAVAYATCVDCSTAAIAVQIVLVERTPSVVTPENVALAINDQCSSCVTSANALQFVQSTDGPARFDDTGQDTLRDVRHELDQIKDDIRNGEVTLADLQARVEAIRASIRDVLANHLIAARGHDHNFDENDDRTAHTTAPNTTTSSATPGAPTGELSAEARSGDSG